MQSNVEDVAVAMRDMVERAKPASEAWFEIPRFLVAGIATVEASGEVGNEYVCAAEPHVGTYYDTGALGAKLANLRWASLSGREACSQRQLLWIESGGRRAEGLGWLADTPFPHGAMSETEAVYRLNDRDVHRVWMMYKTA